MGQCPARIQYRPDRTVVRTKKAIKQLRVRLQQCCKPVSAQGRTRRLRITNSNHQLPLETLKYRKITILSTQLFKETGISLLMLFSSIQWM